MSKHMRTRPRVSPMAVRETYLRARLAAMTGRRGLAPFEIPHAIGPRINRAIKKKNDMIGMKAKYTAWTPW